MPSSFTTVYALNKPAQGDTPWTTQINGDWDSLDAELARPRWPFNSPVVGATTTCDLSLARTFVFTVTQATTLAFTNVPSSSFTTRVVLLVTNGSAFALTFPASVLWLVGAGPTFRVSGVDIVELITRDGGTTWYASKMTAGGVIYETQSLTTTSAVEASIATFPLPANVLTANGHQVRISAGGQQVGGTTGLPVIKFGATAVCGTNGNVSAGTSWWSQGVVVRTGAATQVAIFPNGANVTFAVNRTTPVETLSSPVVIDIRGSVAAGGTLRYDFVMIELLVQ